MCEVYFSKILKSKVGHHLVIFLALGRLPKIGTSLKKIRSAALIHNLYSLHDVEFVNRCYTYAALHVKMTQKHDKNEIHFFLSLSCRYDYVLVYVKDQLLHRVLILNQMNLRVISRVGLRLGLYSFYR